MATQTYPLFQWRDVVWGLTLAVIFGLLLHYKALSLLLWFVAWMVLCIASNALKNWLQRETKRGQNR